MQNHFLLIKVAPPCCRCVRGPACRYGVPFPQIEESHACGACFRHLACHELWVLARDTTGISLTRFEREKCLLHGQAGVLPQEHD